MKQFVLAILLLVTVSACSSDGEVETSGNTSETTQQLGTTVGQDQSTETTTSESSDSTVEGAEETTITSPADTTAATTAAATSGQSVFSPSGNPIEGTGQVSELSSGYRFTEGPAWVEDLDAWLFTDIPNSRVVQVTPSGQESTFSSRIGNGVIVDSRGNIVLAGNAGRDLVSFDSAGNETTIADAFQGTRFNSPNDLVELPGVGYFITDPIFGSAAADLCRGVYLVTYSGDVTQTLCNSGNPNGIVLSPDLQTVYIALSSNGQVLQASVDPTTGEVGSTQAFAQTSGIPDGMVVDGAGNVYVTANAGVEVYGSNGVQLGVISVPQKPSNVALGGPNGNTLLITAVTSVYTVDIN